MKRLNNFQAFAFALVARGENKLSVRNESTGRATLTLIGVIGKSFWDDTGITEQEVRDALKSIPAAQSIDVMLNSEGGSVKEGLGIYNAFKERRDKITVHITGYALSIASVFPLGAGKVVSPKSAIWMMHKAWSWNQGNADDMRHAAEMLDTHDETLIDIYATETGKTKDEIRSAMEKETWIKGADAVAFGLADESDDDADDAQAAFRPLAKDFISRCKNISPEILNCISGGTPQGAAAPKNGGQQTTNQPQDRTMKKTVLVALLTTHGILNATTKKAFTSEDADADFEAGLNALAEKKIQKDSSADNLADLKSIRDELKALKHARVKDQVDAAVDAQKITKAEAKIYLAQAISSPEAEKEVLDLLAEKQPVDAGLTAGAHVISVEDGPNMSENGVQGSKIVPELENLFKAHKSPEQRYEAMKEEFPRLLAKAFRKDAGGVQGANTFSGTVTTNFLIQGVVVKTSGRFAAANLFTRDNTQDPYKPLAAGIMKFNSTTTDGSKVGVNVTNFETLAGATAGNDDSVIDPITITPAQYTAGGHITNAELNSGFRVADLVESKIIDLAAKITQVLTAPVTVANFVTNAPLVVAPAAFGFSDLATLQGQLKKTTTKNLLLDGEYLARIANTPGFFQSSGTVEGAASGGQSGWSKFGWDNVALNTDWSGAGANVRGLACGKNAIGTISGLPLNPPEGIPGNIVQMGVAQLPGVQMAIAVYVWFSPQARTLFFTFDNMCGATLLDELQGVIVKSA